MKITCSQCGKTFELTQNEINFYNSKGLDLPKRCKSCRDKNSGKYIVAYTQKKPENLVFSVLFFALGVAISYFTFKMKTLSGIVPVAIIVCSFLLSFALLVNVQKRKTVDVSFNEKYQYKFYDAQNFLKHYYKQKNDVGVTSLESYLKLANKVITDKKSVHKTISNGDIIYYNKQTQYFVVLSKAGYIRSLYKSSYNHYLKQ